MAPTRAVICQGYQSDERYVPCGREFHTKRLRIIRCEACRGLQRRNEQASHRKGEAIQMAADGRSEMFRMMLTEWGFNWGPAGDRARR